MERSGRLNRLTCYSGSKRIALRLGISSLCVLVWPPGNGAGKWNGSILLCISSPGLSFCFVKWHSLKMHFVGVFREMFGQMVYLLPLCVGTGVRECVTVALGFFPHGHICPHSQVNVSEQPVVETDSSWRMVNSHQCVGPRWNTL